MCPIMKTIAIVKNVDENTKVVFKLPVCRPMIDKHIKDHGGKISIPDLKPCLCNFRVNLPDIPGFDSFNPESWPIQLRQDIERAIKKLPDDIFEVSGPEEMEEKLTKFLEENGLLGGDDE